MDNSEQLEKINKYVNIGKKKVQKLETMKRETMELLFQFLQYKNVKNNI